MLSVTFTNSCCVKVTPLLLILSCHSWNSRRKDELKLVYYHHWWPSSFSLGRCPSLHQPVLQSNLFSYQRGDVTHLSARLPLLLWNAVKYRDPRAASLNDTTSNTKNTQWLKGWHWITLELAQLDWKTSEHISYSSIWARTWGFGLLSWWDRYMFRIPQKQVSEESFLISSPLGSKAFLSVRK